MYLNFAWFLIRPWPFIINERVNLPWVLHNLYATVNQIMQVRRNGLEVSNLLQSLPNHFDVLPEAKESFIADFFKFEISRIGVNTVIVIFEKVHDSILV